MSMRIHRFDFSNLRDFRGPIVVNTTTDEVEREPCIAPPPPVFTLQDLEAARLAGKAEGYTEGFSAGMLEAKKQSDNLTEQANHVIGQLAESLSKAHQDYRHLINEESAHVKRLSLSVAHKIACEAMDARGDQVIAAIIDRAMPVIFSKPRIIIELHPDVFERAVNRIESQMRTQGFEGEVQFNSNPSIGPSDVVLNWGSGEINRDAATLWNEIESLIERIPFEITFSETLDAQTNKSTGA